MDTISSREPNPNFLPMVGIAIGALALIFSIIAILKMPGFSKDISMLKGVSDKVDSFEIQIAQVNPAQITTQVNQAISEVKSLQNYTQLNFKGTQDAFNTISNELAAIKARLDRVEVARPAPSTPPAATTTATGGGGTPVRATTPPATPVAGSNEYIVRKNDTGMAIARANGVSLQALMAANPDVNWNRLIPGQKLKLPARQ